MAIAGVFAGIGGALDILGWQFRLGVIDIQSSTIGFIGIAVALLGRNTAVGVALSALLFGALLNGTSTRNLDPEVFQPELAGNLTLMIQALVLLFVGADVLILLLWRRLRRLRPQTESRGAGGAGMSVRVEHVRVRAAGCASRRAVDRDRRASSCRCSGSGSSCRR